jgi:hypothetical protein
MNERIDKLLVEAGARFGGDGVVYDTFDPKKFAELIVQECVDIACKHMELNEGTDYNIGERIKQHFGVEE